MPIHLTVGPQTLLWELVPNAAHSLHAEAAEMEIAEQSSALLLKQRARLKRALTLEDLVRCMLMMAHCLFRQTMLFVMCLMSCLCRCMSCVFEASCEPSMLQESHQYGITNELLQPVVGKDWSSSLSIDPPPKQRKHLGWQP